MGFGWWDISLQQPRDIEWMRLLRKGACPGERRGQDTEMEAESQGYHWSPWIQP